MTPAEERYRQIIELLEKELSALSDKEGKESLHEEIASLTFSVVGEVKECVDIAELERKLSPYKRVDSQSLKKALSILENAQDRLVARTSPSGTVLDPKERLRLLSAHLKDIEEQEFKLGEIEVLLRLELLLNSLFDHVLMCLLPKDPALSELKQLLKSKLDALKDDDIMMLWGAVQKEFRSKDDPSGFVVDDKAHAFLQISSIQNVKDKLVEYLVEFRPQLRIQAVEQERTIYLQPVLGVPRLLTLRTHANLEPITTDQANLLRVLSKVVWLWDACFARPKEEILNFFGVPADGFVAVGEEHRKLTKIRNHNEPLEKLLLLQLQKVLSYVGLLGAPTSNIEKVLWVYKLGLEVTMPDSGKRLKNLREERIQRELCKFLLEHGIQAYGTKFGSSEIDLLLQQGGEQYVIETKVYTTSPSGNQIRKNLVQLQMYMSQQRLTPKGVLVIYNFTDTAIVPPRKWILGRYQILPINLGTRTPSRKEKSIEIEVAGGEELIKCHANGPSGRKAKPGLRQRRRKVKG